MDGIEDVLRRSSAAVAEGRGLDGTGFWSAVAKLRRDPVAAQQYGEEIARIDRAAFERGVTMRMRVGPGIALLTLGSVCGLGLVVAPARAGAPPDGFGLLTAPTYDLTTIWGFVPFSFLLGFGLLLVSTHSLAHFVFGRALGMRFTHVFLGGPPPPRPGVKTDYASYLRTPPRGRAVMHASGAVVTKILPFALLPASGRLYHSWPWITFLLLVVGVVQIVTDVLISTRVSDWKKVRRELRAARSAG